MEDDDADRGVGRRRHALFDDSRRRRQPWSFIRQVLAPTLLAGDIVIMDNLSSHKGLKVRELVEAAGASVLYLPPYSPDLNPIELAFSKLKQLMRSVGHRSMQALWSDVQRMLDQITAGDAAGFLRHCGYTLQMK